MYEKMKDDYKITFIRGATTASGNSVREIEVAVVELINELMNELINELINEWINEWMNEWMNEW